jgi:hypothetical protein
MYLVFSFQTKIHSCYAWPDPCDETLQGYEEIRKRI